MHSQSNAFKQVLIHNVVPPQIPFAVTLKTIWDRYRTAMSNCVQCAECTDCVPLKLLPVDALQPNFQGPSILATSAQSTDRRRPYYKRYNALVRSHIRDRTF